MNDRRELERRYRRWLSCYPRSFRDRHEDEMIEVLLRTADSGATRPTIVDAADLALHGLQQRAAYRMPGDWERAHARVMFPLRIVIITWLCLISSLLIGYDRGQWWLTVLVPAIALHAYIAYSSAREPVADDPYGFEDPAAVRRTNRRTVIPLKLLRWASR